MRRKKRGGRKSQMREEKLVVLRVILRDFLSKARKDRLRDNLVNYLVIRS